MNKFKFGDRVWHEKYGLCLITRSEPLGLYSIAHNNPTMAQIPYLISESELTPATDWVKCSERMPELNVPVLIHTGSRMQIDKAYDFGDGVSFYEDLYGDAPTRPAARLTQRPRGAFLWSRHGANPRQLS